MSDEIRPLTRNPPPVQNNDIGPAQYNHQITHLGELPSQMQQGGIKFKQERPRPEGVTSRDLPITDQGTLTQGCAVEIVRPNQQYPVDPIKVTSLGPQVESKFATATVLKFGGLETNEIPVLERCPPPQASNDIGPASFCHEITHTGGLPGYKEQRGIKFRTEELPDGVSRRSLPIVDQGTLKQGAVIATILPSQQYPVNPRTVTSLEKQSKFTNCATLKFSSSEQMLERCPPPQASNDIGPASFCHEITHTGGLPGYKEQRGIKFRTEELPDGVSRRSLPVVDQGMLKQGVLVQPVTPFQQYPGTVGPGMGRQIESKFRTAGGTVMSKRIGAETVFSGRMPTTMSADHNGPAQFNLSGGSGSMVRKEAKVMTRAEITAKGDALWKLSQARNGSVREWLNEHNKECEVKKGVVGGGEYDPPKKRRGSKSKTGKKDPNVDEDDDTIVAVGSGKKKGGGPEMTSIADWLERNGRPLKGNKFQAEFDVRRPPRNRGCVQPTFVSVLQKFK